LNVVVASPVWSLNGVNVFAANLVRGLGALGIRSHLLLTRPDMFDSKPMPLPRDIPVELLPVNKHASWPARWRAMIRYLEERAPCIYVPNYDFWHSCVSPQLTGSVGVVGIIHSDDHQHYEHAARLAHCWNAVVAVSTRIAERAALSEAIPASRLVTIPYGVQVPDRMPQRCADKNTPLKVVYAGRLVQRQKRVLDLVKVVEMAVAHNIPVQLTIIGSGPEREQLQEACRGLMAREIVHFPGTVSNQQVIEILARSDAFILTSEYEGMPLSLLEAMGTGCVPVVTDTPSGIPELVQDGINGFRVPVGDIQKFVERLAILHGDTALRRELSSRAYGAIRSGGYEVQEMVQNYLKVFERVRKETEDRSFHRPGGKILPPPSLTWRDYLPFPLQHMIGDIKHLLHVRRK